MTRGLGILFCRPGPGSTFEDGFALEADVADDLGIETHLVDADLVCDGEPERAVARLPDDVGELLYRGPILRAEEYEGLYASLSERGATLVVDPHAYELAMYVPEHHEAIEDLAAPTRWTFGEDVDEAWEAANELGDPRRAVAFEGADGELGRDARVDELAQRLLDALPVAEVAEDRAQAVAGSCRDLLGRQIEARLGEHLGQRVQDALAASLRSTTAAIDRHVVGEIRRGDTTGHGSSLRDS